MPMRLAPCRSWRTCPALRIRLRELPWRGGVGARLCRTRLHRALAAGAGTSGSVNVRRGDIVGVEGHPAKTKLGELSVVPKRMVILTPCLHMLPKSFYGLKDQARRVTGSRDLDPDVSTDWRAPHSSSTRARIINHLAAASLGHAWLPRGRDAHDEHDPAAALPGARRARAARV